MKKLRYLQYPTLTRPYLLQPLDEAIDPVVPNPLVYWLLAFEAGKDSTVELGWRFVDDAAGDAWHGEVSESSPGNSSVVVGDKPKDPEPNRSERRSAGRGDGDSHPSPKPSGSMRVIFLLKPPSIIMGTPPDQRALKHSRGGPQFFWTSLGSILLGLVMLGSVCLDVPSPPTVVFLIFCWVASAEPSFKTVFLIWTKRVFLVGMFPPFCFKKNFLIVVWRFSLGESFVICFLKKETILDCSAELPWLPWLALPATSEDPSVPPVSFFIWRPAMVVSRRTYREGQRNQEFEADSFLHSKTRGPVQSRLQVAWQTEKKL